MEVSAINLPWKVEWRFSSVKANEEKERWEEKKGRLGPVFVFLTCVWHFPKRYDLCKQDTKTPDVRFTCVSSSFNGLRSCPSYGEELLVLCFVDGTSTSCLKKKCIRTSPIERLRPIYPNVLHIIRKVHRERNVPIHSLPYDWYMGGHCTSHTLGETSTKS